MKTDLPTFNAFSLEAAGGRLLVGPDPATLTVAGDGGRVVFSPADGAEVALGTPDEASFRIDRAAVLHSDPKALTLTFPF